MNRKAMLDICNVSHCVEENKCFGCSACAQACPQKSISMMEDKEGFLFPDVNEETCIDCGKCASVCPSLKHESLVQAPMKSFIACSKNREECSNSSSGGIFYQLAKKTVEEEKGIVYGCYLKHDGQAVLGSISTEDDIAKMQGSKYVQADPEKVYAECREHLMQGRKVLFSGTPCQVAALKAFIGKNNNNLILIELVCHGVPSPLLWRSYVAALLEENKITDPSNLAFRYNDKFERTHFSLFEKGGNYVSPWQEDLYYSLFMSFASLRESCYSCPFATAKRCGDLTIGDCSSYLQYKDFHLLEPSSLVLVNTEKGKNALEAIEQTLDWQEINFANEIESNHALSAPEKRPSRRDSVYVDFASLSWKDFEKKYRPSPRMKYYINKIVKARVPVRTRKRIKSMLHR